MIAYGLSIASVLAVLASVYIAATRSSTDLGPSRIAALTRDEARRLGSGDAVFLMHLSIALGVGLSIAGQLLDPVFGYAPVLRIVLLWASIPLVVGLAAAFIWRIQRFLRSKEVESELFHSSPEFSSASTRLQLVLMLAIALTTSELVVWWIPGLILEGALVGVLRNILVAIYYAKPTVNLVRSFDSPLSTVSVPFKLSDVLSGKVDASQVKVGVSTTNEFSTGQRLSFDSCVEIGACEAACPATAAGRPLSPRVLVRKLSILSSSATGGQASPFDAVGEDELWSCTSCGACVSSCPVSVKHLDLIYDLRRDLVAKGKLDREKAGMLENLAKHQNPYGFSQADRASWTKDLGVPSVASAHKVDYVYWVGCISSFDQRAQRVAKSMAKILRHAGVSFAILADEEACNGDPARRLGEEGRYQELAYQNIEKLNSYGVKKIVAACPHCYNTLKNEYPAFGGSYEVVYHTQLISDLITEGRISLPKDRVREISATLHDACYAARYNSVFEEPRRVLEASGVVLHEMGRTKEKTFCCGAGGSNYWFKVPGQKSIAGIRTEEALQTGAKTIATECPFCLSMFDDTTKVMNAHMEVKDVAEIVADSLA